MIDVKELRYGSIIQNKNEVWVVNDIFGASGLITVLPDSKNIGWHGRRAAHDYQGVPLTEEWLLRLGFEKEDKLFNDLSLYIGLWRIIYGTWPNGEKNFQLQADGGYDERGEMDLSTTTKYVHQLQNLYFALTGTELEVKELVK